MSEHPNGRSALAIAMAWASQVTTIALQMALPAVLGFWLDEKLGTWLVFTGIGALVGLIAGMVSLIRLAKQGRHLPGTQGSEPHESPSHRVGRKR